jgi:3,4-dihydroxy 2-butanone 4-phosphate synthase/GTP cyclohydrolase II
VTTGISAADRATTVQAAVNPDARPEDLVQPGHIFPLMAQPGGVLVRAGHTEAGCDLARLAGLFPASVIVEILNEDGTMARRADLEAFAARHNLKMGTIADLIEYRVRNERTVERINECDLQSKYGTFRLISYQDVVDEEVHLALVKGTPQPDQPVLVRVQVQNTQCDLLGSTNPECGWPLHEAMQQVERAGEGVIVILRNYDRARDIVQRIEDCQRPEGDKRIPKQGGRASRELRTFGVGAQILGDLGVTKMRVMSAPTHLHALAGFHLEVTEFVDPD